MAKNGRLRKAAWKPRMCQEMLIDFFATYPFSTVERVLLFHVGDSGHRVFENGCCPEHIPVDAIAAVGPIFPYLSRASCSMAVNSRMCLSHLFQYA